ncbi:UDP-N-acetylmuramoylalanine--D-glutamate ligase [Ureibacillus acetophenoni]
MLFKEPTILIAGGLERGHSFEELRDSMKNVVGVVAFGQTKSRFIEFAKSCGVDTTIEAENVENAVEKAAAISNTGNVILLSRCMCKLGSISEFLKCAVICL